MPDPIFQAREEALCECCGGELSWLRVVCLDGRESFLRNCPRCRWYEASALFTHPTEAFRKRLKDDDAAQAWALRVAYATGSAVELRRSPKVIENNAGESIGEHELTAWIKRGFDDSEAMELIEGPRLLFFWRWRRLLREWWTKDETLGGVCTARYIPYPKSNPWAVGKEMSWSITNSKNSNSK